MNMDLSDMLEDSKKKWAASCRIVLRPCIRRKMGEKRYKSQFSTTANENRNRNNADSREDRGQALDSIVILAHVENTPKEILVAAFST
jgi:hypothetical protein